MKRMFHKRILVIGGLIGLDSLFFGLTSPTKVPSILLIVGFLLLALTIYHLFRLFLVVISLYGLPTRDHAKRLARLFAGLVAGVLALQSIGELSLRDIMVLTPLAGILYAYLTYGQAKAIE